jgi:leader peptidase (prepilin peptidase)/N-methyltransferase
MVYQTLFLFILGTAIGSFLNVLILRYKPGENVFGKHLGGRSKCPHCGKVLKWYELIPILSFVIQLGRCRKCKKSISIQYPVVEILSGVIMATVPLMMGLTLYSFVWVAVLLLLLAASVIDIRSYVIPDMLTLSVAFLGVIATALIALGKAGSTSLIPGTFLGSYAYVFSFTQNPWIGHIAAAVVGASFFSVIILLSKGKAMGWGDAKLAGAIGLFLGWPDTIMVLMIAFILGAVIGSVLLATKKKKLKDALPFGPYIAVGTAIIFYWGLDIMTLYFRFLNLGV